MLPNEPRGIPPANEERHKDGAVPYEVNQAMRIVGKGTALVPFLGHDSNCAMRDAEPGTNRPLPMTRGAA